MIDENKTLMLAGQDGSWRGPWIDAIDRNPPAATPFASVKKLRECIAGHQVLFTPADNDAFVPANTLLRSIEKFLVPGCTEVRRLPGGHHAIFLENGYETLMDWTRDRI